MPSFDSTILAIYCVPTGKCWLNFVQFAAAREYFRDTALFPAIEMRRYQCSRKSTSAEISKVFQIAEHRQKQYDRLPRKHAISETSFLTFFRVIYCAVILCGLFFTKLHLCANQVGWKKFCLVHWRWKSAEWAMAHSWKYWIFISIELSPPCSGKQTNNFHTC